MKKSEILAILARIGISYPVLVFEGIKRGLLAEVCLLDAILGLRCDIRFRGPTAASPDPDLVARSRNSDPVYLYLLYKKLEEEPGMYRKYGVHWYAWDCAKAEYLRYKKAFADQGMSFGDRVPTDAILDGLVECVKLGFAEHVFFVRRDPLRPMLIHEDLNYKLLGIDRYSIVDIRGCDWVVGEVEVGKDARWFVKYPTVVSSDWILANCLERVGVKSVGEPLYDQVDDMVQVFGHPVICGNPLTAEDTLYQIVGEGAQIIFQRWLMEQLAYIPTGNSSLVYNEKLRPAAQWNWDQLVAVANINRFDLPREIRFLKDIDEILTWIKARVGKAERLADIEDIYILKLPDAKRLIAEKAEKEAQQCEENERLFSAAMDSLARPAVPENTNNSEATIAELVGKSR